MPLDPETPLPARFDLSEVPDRATLLNDNPIRIHAQRWRRLISELDLPAAQGPLAEGDWIYVSRREVFAAADTEIDSGAATQLFYLSLAWGLGAKARLLRSRLNGFADLPERAPQLLAQAWQAVRDGLEPAECYEFLMWPRGRGHIPFFGPAFATKFLYFAAGSSRTPRLLILDAVVAGQLQQLEVWEKAPTYNWWSSTYQNYCGLLHLWADEAGKKLGREVAPDQIELALFRRRFKTAKA